MRSGIQENKKKLLQKGYNALDFFYWEEKMSNWAAKGKSETRVLDVEMISPFNSRGLLKLFLSTSRNSRESTNSKLHHKIIEHLSDKHQELKKITINPTKDIIRARIMWKFGIYKLFTKAQLQARMLKVRLKG